MKSQKVARELLAVAKCLVGNDRTAAMIETVRPIKRDGYQGDNHYRKMMYHLFDLLHAAEIQAGQIDTQVQRMVKGDPMVDISTPFDPEDPRVSEMRNRWNKIGDWAISIANEISKIKKEVSKK
jgi:hypothetical protein